jgi:cell division protein FtsB
MIAFYLLTGTILFLAALPLVLGPILALVQKYYQIRLDYYVKKTNRLEQHNEALVLANHLLDNKDVLAEWRDFLKKKRAEKS